MKSFLNNIIILLIVGIVVYSYFRLDKAGVLDTQSDDVQTLAIEDASPDAQYPVTDSPVNSAAASLAKAKTEEPLPSLLESDSKIKEILSGNFDDDLVNQIIQQTGIIHRFVVTIDSLPKKELPVKYRLLPPTPGKFAVREDSNYKFTLDQDNFARYDDQMHLLRNLDTELFVKWYKRFYPLIQEDYESLGYKNKHFNDRFIFTIDHLLETPETIGSIELTQPSVFYKFADSDMQNLSSGQKILVRIGPSNMAIVKTKLFKIRKALASAQ